MMPPRTPGDYHLVGEDPHRILPRAQHGPGSRRLQLRTGHDVCPRLHPGAVLL